MSATTTPIFARHRVVMIEAGQQAGSCAELAAILHPASREIKQERRPT
jgi:hypothetical protein